MHILLWAWWMWLWTMFTHECINLFYTSFDNPQYYIIELCKIIPLPKRSSRCHSSQLPPATLLCKYSLSEPHTNGTALQDACVSYVWPYTENLNWTNRYNVIHFKFAHILSSSSHVQWTMIWWIPHYLTPRQCIYWMWLQTMTDKDRQLTDVTVKSCTCSSWVSFR